MHLLPIQHGDLDEEAQKQGMCHSELIEFTEKSGVYSFQAQLVPELDNGVTLLSVIFIRRDVSSISHYFILLK